jgi:hypothetical protein
MASLYPTKWTNQTVNCSSHDVNIQIRDSNLSRRRVFVLLIASANFDIESPSKLVAIVGDRNAKNSVRGLAHALTLESKLTPTRDGT